MAEYKVTKRPNRRPTHPGIILRNRVVKELGIPVTEFADNLKIKRQSLYKIFSGAGPITPNIAVRLGRYLGNGPNIWLRMQAAYDVWDTEQKYADELKDIQIRRTA